MTITKLINKATSILTIIVMLWIGLSYMEILVKNTRENPVYSRQNILVMAVEWMEGLGR